MARIRSVHPEQWVDEEFVTSSELARLLALGVRNFADDNGVFEWKPRKLKMQILPADNANMDELLRELVEANQIARYEVDGKPYGIIRNFRKYQKPKKPTAYYPLPSKLVGNSHYLDAPLSSEPVGKWGYTKTSPSSVPVPNRYGNSSSEGEKRREEKRKKERTLASSKEIAEKKPKRRKPETPLPEDWTLPDDWRVKAVERRPDIDPDLEAEKFLNHALQNDRRCRGWGRAWLNWIIGAKPQIGTTQRQRAGAEPPLTEQETARAKEILAELKAKDAELEAGGQTRIKTSGEGGDSGLLEIPPFLKRDVG